MSDELRVVLRFLQGPATVSQDVLGRKLSGQIKEELFHNTHNAVLCRLFLCLAIAAAARFALRGLVAARRYSPLHRFATRSKSAFSGGPFDFTSDFNPGVPSANAVTSSRMLAQMICRQKRSIGP
jgi:hypothetical protein